MEIPVQLLMYVISGVFSVPLTIVCIFLCTWAIRKRRIKKELVEATETERKLAVEAETEKEIFTLLNSGTLRPFNATRYTEPICPKCNNYTFKGENIQDSGFSWLWWICKCRNRSCGFHWIMVSNDDDVQKCKTDVNNTIAKLKTDLQQDKERRDALATRKKSQTPKHIDSVSTNFTILPCLDENGNQLEVGQHVNWRNGMGGGSGIIGEIRSPNEILLVSDGRVYKGFRQVLDPIKHGVIATTGKAMIDKNGVILETGQKVGWKENGSPRKGKIRHLGIAVGAKDDHISVTLDSIIPETIIIKPNLVTALQDDWTTPISEQIVPRLPKGWKKVTAIIVPHESIDDEGGLPIDLGCIPLGWISNENALEVVRASDLIITTKSKILKSRHTELDIPSNDECRAKPTRFPMLDKNGIVLKIGQKVEWEENGSPRKGKVRHLRTCGGVGVAGHDNHISVTLALRPSIPETVYVKPNLVTALTTEEREEQSPSPHKDMSSSNFVSDAHQMYSETGCFCQCNVPNARPPCSFCESLTEEEVEVLDSAEHADELINYWHVKSGLIDAVEIMKTIVKTTPPDANWGVKEAAAFIKTYEEREKKT